MNPRVLRRSPSPTQWTTLDDLLRVPPRRTRLWLVVSLLALSLLAGFWIGRWIAL